MQKVIYPLSLIALAVAMYLIITYPDSGKMNLIAGALFTIGIVLNIVGYIMAKRSFVKV